MCRSCGRMRKDQQKQTLEVNVSKEPGRDSMHFACRDLEATWFCNEEYPSLQVLKGGFGKISECHLYARIKLKIQVKFAVDDIQSNCVRLEKVAYKCNLLGESDQTHLGLM